MILDAGPSSNGKDQKVVVVLRSKENEKERQEKIGEVDYCIVVDVSSSMRGKKLDIVKSALKNLIRVSAPGSTLTIVVFAEKSRVICDRQPVKDCLKFAEMLQASGATNIVAGMELGFGKVVELQHQKPSRKVAVFAFTDGEATIGCTKDDLINASFRSMFGSHDGGVSSDTDMMLVAVGSSANRNLLREMSTCSGRGQFQYISETRLENLAGELGGFAGIISHSRTGTILVDGKCRVQYRLPFGEQRAFAMDVCRSSELNIDGVILNASKSTPCKEAKELVRLHEMKDELLRVSEENARNPQGMKSAFQMSLRNLKAAVGRWKLDPKHLLVPQKEVLDDLVERVSGMLVDPVNIPCLIKRETSGYSQSMSQRFSSDAKDVSGDEEDSMGKGQPRLKRQLSNCESTCDSSKRVRVSPCPSLTQGMPF